MQKRPESIDGYRNLNETEIAAINSLKHFERTLLTMLNRISADMPLLDRRWMAIARTHLEQGFMAAVRSIARPE